MLLQIPYDTGDFYMPWERESYRVQIVSSPLDWLDQIRLELSILLASEYYEILCYYHANSSFV